MSQEENKYLKLGSEEYTQAKRKRKIFRVIVQVAILLLITYIAVNAIFTIKKYVPYSEQPDVTFAGDKGFIAVSYIGVDRVGSQSLISENRLHEHLSALKNAGYVTITQQDILDYYQSGKTLPARSMVLLFEDGRRDTIIFSDKVIEDLNLKATILTYPEKFDRKDPKFLLPEDLISLGETTFWEFGTNGFRLYFINVFDRYNNYLGELEPLKHSSVASYLGRNYNHYLMDYIRDENGFPKESYDKMKSRIDYDYEALREVYTESIGYVPGMYVLMHSNTGSFGTNDKASAINAYWIHKLFTMNFNREGNAFNTKRTSIYDLTRIQPQAYWYSNHLIMRIRHDTKEEIPFVSGVQRLHEPWTVLRGALEANEERLILTSVPEETSLMRLNDINPDADMQISVRLRGNKFGDQAIYLRADDSLEEYVSVKLVNNHLYVMERKDGNTNYLFSLNLDRHDGIPAISIPEDKKAAEIRALETFIRYSPSVELAKIYSERLKDKMTEMVPTVEDGAPEYIPLLSIHARGDRMLYISLKDDKIRVDIDGKTACSDVEISKDGKGGFYLGSVWGGYGWSQRNIVDDVYDGVFEGLWVTENSGKDMGDEKILYDGRLTGINKIIYDFLKRWDALLDWFITNM